MSPNQPKTPISSFRLDDETKERLRRAAESMGTSMTEAVRQASIAAESASKATERLVESWRAADPAMAAHVDATANRAVRTRAFEASERVRNALADYLVLEAWPNATPREVAMHRRNTYSVMAAAILAGEAWAIRKAWPEAAAEIADTRPA